MENPTTINGFDFILLIPQELSQVTGIIYPGLREIQRQARKKGLDWELQNILREIEVNFASLVMIYKERQYVGFMVNKSIYVGSPNRHLYQTVALYVEPIFRSFDGLAYNSAEEYASLFAKELKCQGCLQRSFRIGHGKKLEKRGYELKEMTWIKEF